MLADLACLHAISAFHASCSVGQFKDFGRWRIEDRSRQFTSELREKGIVTAFDLTIVVEELLGQPAHRSARRPVRVEAVARWAECASLVGRRQAEERFAAMQQAGGKWPAPAERAAFTNIDDNEVAGGHIAGGRALCGAGHYSGLCVRGALA